MGWKIASSIAGTVRLRTALARHGVPVEMELIQADRTPHGGRFHRWLVDACPRSIARRVIDRLGKVGLCKGPLITYLHRPDTRCWDDSSMIFRAASQPETKPA
jgi:hypothetical protein